MPNLRWIIVALPGLVAGFAFHEYAHARMADRLGDPTPRFYGRLTLEPWAHLDIVGTLLLLFYGFGWAKPVPVNPYLFKRPRQDMLKVAAAGPGANVLIALVLAILMRLGVGRLPIPFLDEVLMAGFTVNLGMAVFNLLPIPPLDGSKVLAGLVPHDVASHIDRLERYGPVFLMLVLYSGALNGLLYLMRGTVMAAVWWIADSLTWFMG